MIQRFNFYALTTTWGEEYFEVHTVEERMESRIQNNEDNGAGFNMWIIDTVSLHDDGLVNYNTIGSTSVLVL